MSTGEADRYHLVETVRQRFDGERAAGTLMSLLPADRDQLATKNDIAAATAASKRDLDAAMAARKQDHDAAMAGMRHQLDTAVQRLDDRINDLGRNLILAMMGSWLTLVALIVSLRFA